MLLSLLKRVIVWSSQCLPNVNILYTTFSATVYSHHNVIHYHHIVMPLFSHTCMIFHHTVISLLLSCYHKCNHDVINVVITMLTIFRTFSSHSYLTTITLSSHCHHIIIFALHSHCSLIAELLRNIVTALSSPFITLSWHSLYDADRNYYSAILADVFLCW